MHDDVIREGTAADPINTWGPYSGDIRRSYVELYLASQPISLRQFAEKYGINRVTLSKWLYLYEGIKPEPGRTRHLPKGGKPAPAADSKPAQASDDAIRTVTIPCTEYLELLEAKAKLTTIQAVCR